MEEQDRKEKKGEHYTEQGKWGVKKEEKQGRENELKKWIEREREMARYLRTASTNHGKREKEERKTHTLLLRQRIHE